jgi:hypothetical protein
LLINSEKVDCGLGYESLDILSTFKWD